MQHLYDLEINILSCLLQEPKLMQQITFEDKHIIKHQRIWQFMKAFYNKYETFDIILMYQVCKDKYQIFQYIQWLIDVEPIPSRFNLYQKQLIEAYEQKEKEKYIIQKIFSKANELYVGSVSLNDFKEYIEKVEDDANVIFKEGDEIVEDKR